ncbi:MAG TPA: response regulator [Ramlibacter sp.]|uniref:response regulator transcription factor n=1 Tax=Ramlibacter sp. TaxID=1917967 RepID=UPI002CDC4B46|nr:response regulator [Ramlibacter sp.]HVZ44256.1 response regulator [Ramlibacter sp.]
MISVMMIEDSREILALVADLLEQAGPYEVIGNAATEGEGTNWLQENPGRWDMAIIDLVLRDGSGFNLIRRYRAANEHARILVLSDYATPNIKVRCVEFGADAVFTKADIEGFVNYLSNLRPPTQPIAAH